VALEDDTVMSYLLSGRYVAQNELAISVSDPALGLPLDAGVEPILSERDRVAITFAEAQQRGLLPDYATSLEIERRLSEVSVSA
jgi:epimerase EvaD